jgi:hypothetical protein
MRIGLKNTKKFGIVSTKNIAATCYLYITQTDPGIGNNVENETGLFLIPKKIYFRDEKRIFFSKNIQFF